MFNISFAELIVILLLGALVLGPEEIGAVARFCGRAARKSRGLLAMIKEYVNEDEIAELKAIKTPVDEMREIKDSLNPEISPQSQNSAKTHKES